MHAHIRASHRHTTDVEATEDAHCPESSRGLSVPDEVCQLPCEDCGKSGKTLNRYPKKSSAVFIAGQKFTFYNWRVACQKSFHVTCKQ